MCDQLELKRNQLETAQRSDVCSTHSWKPLFSQKTMRLVSRKQKASSVSFLLFYLAHRRVKGEKRSQHFNCLSSVHDRKIPHLFTGKKSHPPKEPAGACRYLATNTLRWSEHPVNVLPSLPEMSKTDFNIWKGFSSRKADRSSTWFS